MDLSLPEFTILKKETNEYDYKFTVETSEAPILCPHCHYTYVDIPGIDGEPFKRHGVRDRLVSDVDMHRKRVKILIKHRRWKCPKCDKTFFEMLGSVDTNGKITKRLYVQLQKDSLQKPFSQVAEDYGISNMTVRRAFDDFVISKEKDRVLKAPRVIGIDEAHLNKIMRGVITDIENRRILEMTENNLKRTIKATIQSMEGYKDIEVATMDMATGYRYAMNELVPNALCIIDKFHVVKEVLKALDKVRISFKKSISKEERRKLLNDRWLMLSNQEDLKPQDIEKRDYIFKLYPALLIPYYLKEGLRAVYKATDRKEAYERYYEWEQAIPDDLLGFKNVANTINSCKNEVFNYFLTPIKYTNAYTESINNIIKRIEKSGVGYSYEVLRAKVLYGTIATKKPKWGETNFYTIDNALMNGYFDLNPYEELEIIQDDEGFYVDITTLLGVMDRGEF